MGGASERVWVGGGRGVGGITQTFCKLSVCKSKPGHKKSSHLGESRKCMWVWMFTSEVALAKKSILNFENKEP